MFNKVSGLLTSVLCLLLLTSCGIKNNNKVVCSSVETQGDIKMTTEIVATIKDENVKSLTATVTFDSLEDAELYSEILSRINSSLLDNDKLNISVNGKQIVIGNYEKMIEQDADEVEGIRAVKIIDESKDDFIKIMNEQKYSCK